MHDVATVIDHAQTGDPIGRSSFSDVPEVRGKSGHPSASEYLAGMMGR